MANQIKIPLFLGMTLAARPDWETFFLEPIATKSTKPESVAKEIEVKREKRADSAPFTEFSGTVTSVAIHDAAGQVVYEVGPGTPGECSHQAITAIVTMIPALGRGDVCGVEWVGPAVLYGLRIRDKLRLMAIDALRHAAGSVPPVLWQHRAFVPDVPWFDPFDALLPSDLRNDIDLFGLCRYLNVTAPTIDPDTDAGVQADLARRLAIAGGFVVG